MTDNDYLGRVEQAVRDNVGGEVLALTMTEHSERTDYWERIYMVAWQGAKESGTHRVCINSLGEEALFYGHYQMTPRQALDSLSERANVITDAAGNVRV